MKTIIECVTEPQLEDLLSTPSTADIEHAAHLDGDIVVLGAGGKMGPSLTKRIARSLQAAGSRHRVIGVVRKDRDGLGAAFAEYGALLHEADLMDPETINTLPQAPNVIYMVGRKFGSTGQEHLTWATNAWASGLIGYHYRESRIVAFSTGNVYPFTPVNSGGAVEGSPTGPVGEYAQSALARERIFEYMAEIYRTPVLIFRLNYAIDLRYGVLLDVAEKVAQGKPIDVTMGHANIVWQGDANSYCFRCLPLCTAPARFLNVTGMETLRIRTIAEAFGDLLGQKPVMVGEEAPTALLSNASECVRLLGKPDFTLDQMMELVARWVQAGGRTLGKPTKFEKRDGNF